MLACTHTKEEACIGLGCDADTSSSSKFMTRVRPVVLQFAGNLWGEFFFVHLGLESKGELTRS